MIERRVKWKREEKGKNITMATTQHTGQSFEETELCQDNRNRRVGVLGQARDHNCATYGFRLNLVRYLSYKSHCKVPDKKTQKTCIHSISCSKRILSFSCCTHFVWYIAHSVPHHLLLASFHCWVKVWFLHMSHTHSFTDYKCPWSTLPSSEWYCMHLTIMNQSIPKELSFLWLRHIFKWQSSIVTTNEITIHNPLTRRVRLKAELNSITQFIRLLSIVDCHFCARFSAPLFLSLSSRLLSVWFFALLIQTDLRVKIAHRHKGEKYGQLWWDTANFL